MRKFSIISILSVILSLTCIITPAKATDAIVDVGGAVRLNYAWKDYSDEANGTFEFELFRIDMDVTQGNWFLDSQYRWYQGFESIHHAQVGYHINPNNTLSAGITQVPFGIEPYGSHSFWFSASYYLGLEDDYDSGIKWRHTSGNWTIDTAYFLNSEYDDPSRWGRYSFDISSTYDGERNNKEDGQLNVRAQYKWGKHTLGASIETGEFKNNTSAQHGNRWAAAVHFNGHFDNNWNVQTQYTQYHYDSAQGLGTQDNRIALSAFQYPFDIATQAQIITVNVAKKFVINHDLVDSVTCYNDHSLIAVDKKSGLADSTQNVTGCLVAKGGIYTYVDWIAGKNMWFAGGSGVGIDNGDTGWHSRLNINIGFYF